MPNQPKTPLRTIRIDHDLWEAARRKATKEQTTITAVIRAALVAYTKR